MVSVYDFFLQYKRIPIHLEILDIDKKDFDLAMKLYREKKIGEDSKNGK